MSIRFQGNQHIRTNQLSAFTGATSFTWSLRLQVDALTFSGDARFFGGQFFGMFSLRFVTASGSSAVLAAGATRAAGGLTTPTFSVPIGRPCHLAGVYNGTVLRIYLNAALVATSNVGAADVVSESRPVNVGVESGHTITADYYLGELTLWRDAALAVAQLRELRDGVPLSVDPGTPFMAWSMVGVADQPVLALDDGVRSDRVTPAFISTPPPVFADRDLAYEPIVRVRSAAVAPSGKGVLVYLEDSISGAAVAPSALAVAPTLTIDGAPASLDAVGPLWQANTLPYVYYPLAEPVAEPADVRLSAAGGWALAGSRGEVQGMAGLAVANPGPPILPEIPDAPKRMKIGWNAPGGSPFSLVRFHANLLRQGSPGFAAQSTSSPPTITYDPASGFPSLVEGGEAFTRVVVLSSAPFDTRGYPNIPPGRYTLLWDGTGNARLAEETGYHAMSQVASNLTGPTDKRREYNLTLGAGPSAPRGSQFRLIISGAVANVRIYGPGTPLDGSEKFHPGLIRMLEGAGLIRFMDSTATNNSPRAHYADLPDPDRFSFDTTWVIKTVNATIATIGPHDNTDGYFLSNGRTYLAITTSAPHGFTTGQMVHFTGIGGGPSGNGLLTRGNGTTFDLDAAINVSFPTPCRVLSPTTFAVSVYGGITGAPGQVVGTHAYTGNAQVSIRNIAPYTDCVELANRVGADPWICVPHAFTDEATAALAADVVAALGPGGKLRVEYTNEHWNLANAFMQSEFCHGQGALLGLTASAWYAKRSGEVHAIFAAAMAQAGRAGDLIRVFGSQSANAGVTTQIVGYCAANGVPVDEIAIAPYFYNAPTGSPSRWALLDADQAHDLSDLAILRFKGYAAAHRAILQASYPAAAVVCYEGGMEMGVPIQGYGGNTTAAAALSRAWARHPRIRQTILQYCQQLEDEGCEAFAYYGLAGPFPNYAGLTAAATWFAHQRTDEPVGTGDGSDGLFDNRTDPQNMSSTVSVVGKGVKSWMDLMAKEEKEEDSHRSSSMPRRITPSQLRGRLPRTGHGGR